MLAVLERLASGGGDPVERGVLAQVPVIELGALNVPAERRLAHGHDDLATGAVVAVIDLVVVSAALDDVQILHDFVLLFMVGWEGFRPPGLVISGRTR